MSDSYAYFMMSNGIISDRRTSMYKKQSLHKVQIERVFSTDKRMTILSVSGRGGEGGDRGTAIKRLNIVFRSFVIQSDS
jgi:hypothetical protein